MADELAAIGKGLSLTELNIYLLKGLKHEFKDIVANITARPEPVQFDEIHSLRLSHEFMNQDTLQSMTIIGKLATNTPTVPTATIIQRNNQFGGQNNQRAWWI